MDEAVLRAMARWPDVPDVYGWLALDRRGNWLLKDAVGGSFSRIGNPALRDFIGRNYAVDARGCWYFQNGPQRVFVSLAFTPFVLRFDAGETLRDQCQARVRPTQTYVDEEGSVLMRVERGLGLLDDRDLDRFAAGLDGDWRALPRVSRAEVENRFAFVSVPSDSLR